MTPTLCAAGGHLRPDGQLLVGECIWEQEPSQEVLSLLGASLADYADLAATVDVVASTGWVLLDGHVSSLQEWDEYEWSWIGSLARWALDHPDHPDHLMVMPAAVDHRRVWLKGYPGTLGFLTMLLNRSASRRTC